MSMLDWNAYRKQLASTIGEMLGIAIMVNAGATLVYSARTIDAFHAGAPETTEKP